MKSLKFIILVFSFAAVSAAVSGCSLKFWQRPEVAPVTKNEPAVQNENNNNQLQGQVATSTEESITENNENILKKVGEDENGWNIYQSEKYGFEMMVPENWRIDSYNSYKKYQNILFQNNNVTSTARDFYISIGSYEKELGAIDTKTKYIQWACLESQERDKCISNKTLFVKNFTTVIINDLFGVKVLEKTGKDMISAYYYFLNNEIIYNFSMDLFEPDLDSNQNQYYDIVKTFKLLNKN